ncbi:MAG: hypothetical protein GX415_07355 [Chloroflexi bacterium]|jgi:hypothetical protein|nr:hypothetical protein [Anaerolineaceae bacterium]NLI45204.1 hypothetical protein [Chloroflexota bacterium]HOE34731.1 hypothetical protein [Anaerolineaceae bacterium]HOT25363.1 hypothetical protein [Anaerolineaceae bacterium]HQH57330.1 hypothetical protein [Anaerolineaceae bacterium]
MKLVINEKLIKKNKTIGQVTTFASLAVLAVGLVFAFGKDMTRILYSYVALIVGFVLSQVGMYFSTRFGRSPRFDELFTGVFEKLRHDYTFYVFSSPVPYLLLGPCAIWVPIPLTASGKISYENGKWKQQGGNFMMKVFGQEGIGRPVQEINANTAMIRKYLAEKGIPEEEQPPIKHIMVVLMKNTMIGEISEAPIPVVNLEDLKRSIRRVDRDECEAPLTEEQIARLTAALNDYSKKNS